MALVSASALSKSFGTSQIITNANFEIGENDKIGLIGMNGCGKTTLFQILTEKEAYDSGTLTISKTAHISYMEQHVCRDGQITAYAEVLSVFAPLMAMETEINDLHIQLQAKTSGLDSIIEKHAHLSDKFIADGGLTFKSRTRSALSGLGFTQAQIANPVMTLSGGQKAKLQLAKMLLSGASLLLLDEPTNHLDIASVEWLEDFLRGFRGAILVISHDRYFLDKLTNKTFEIEAHHLSSYKGNYTTAQKLKAEHNKTTENKYVNTQKEIKRIEGIVEQQRRWGREKNIKTAESKQKSIDRLAADLEKPTEKQNTLSFEFGTANRSGNDVLDITNFTLQHGDNVLCSNLNLSIKRAERTFLLGANGSGKTSLFKKILLANEAKEPSIHFGTSVTTGYYDQIGEGLTSEKTVLEEVWDRYPTMSQTEVRKALASFLFTSDEVFKPIATLSGGQRARVLLLCLMLSNANFLLLDEPTNHLDIPSAEALENALLHYNGTLFIISHDRYFIDKLATKIFTLTQKELEIHKGNYETYAKRLQETPMHNQVCAPKPVKQNDYKMRKEMQSELRKTVAEIKTIEKEIADLENQLSVLEEALQTPEVSIDYTKALAVTGEMEQVKNTLDEKFDRWALLLEQN